MRVLLAILLAAAAPAAKHDAADMKAARTSVLAAADLGKGWTGKASPQAGVSLSCKGWSPSGAGIVETGAAASPSLSAATTGPFLYQATSIYATAAQANTYWARAVKPGIVACAVQNVEALAARGVKVSVISRGKLPLSSALAHTAAFRVKARANKLTLYFDVLLFGNGRTITTVSLSSFQSAPPPAFEEILARIVARKLGGPAA
jgi:hypothetical protein